MATINSKRCIGCGLCEKKCPKEIIEILPEKFSQHVRCKNTDKGALTRKICKVGCIGCMKCKKVCESGAIKIENFCATMDYHLCTNCHKCTEVCPVKTIT